MIKLQKYLTILNINKWYNFICNNKYYQLIFIMFCCPALASQQISGKAFVLDGDSLNINKQQIRLNGIDAPEYSQQCLDKNSQLYSCGLNSKNFLINLVKGKIVDCYYDKLDIYKRILATCYVQNLNINNHLLANGMVVIYDFNYATQQQIQLETSAKEQQKGIWQGSFQLPKTYRKSKKKYDKN